MIQGDSITITGTSRRWWQFWRWHEPQIDGTYQVTDVSSSTITLGEEEDALPWRCFHCCQVLYTEHAARQHFGPDEGYKPACQIKANEGGLLAALREAENEAQKAWAVVHSEGADGLQAYHGNLSRHASALRSAEEAGYARGLRDSSVADGFTYAVQHNPNCPKPYLVRLPRGVLDFKAEGLSTDAIGYGLTFLEAFAAAQDKLAKPAPTEADVIECLLDQARVL